MKKILLILVIVIFFPSISFAHPGRTASDGCHYCRTNCDKWGVAWNQRHCHGGYSAPTITTPKPTSTSTYSAPKTSYNSTSTSLQLNNTATKSITPSVGTSNKVQNTEKTTTTSGTAITTSKPVSTNENNNYQNKQSSDDSSLGIWMVVIGAGGYLYWRHKNKNN